MHVAANGRSRHLKMQVRRSCWTAQPLQFVLTFSAVTNR